MPRLVKKNNTKIQAVKVSLQWHFHKNMLIQRVSMNSLGAGALACFSSSESDSSLLELVSFFLAAAATAGDFTGALAGGGVCEKKCQTLQPTNSKYLYKAQ